MRTEPLPFPFPGVIHKPFEKVTAWGWAGPNIVSQAIEDDMKARAGGGEQQDLSKARIIVSRSHAGDVTATAQVRYRWGVG